MLVWRHNLCLSPSLSAEMTSGKVALYALSLQSSCVDPKDVPTAGGRVNVVSALEEKTNEEIKHYCKKTNAC